MKNETAEVRGNYEALKIRNQFPNGILEKLGLTPVAFFGILILAMLPYIPPFDQEYLIRWLIAGAFIAAGAMAFDFTSGYISIVNFGFYAFIGLGGYTSALLVSHLGISPLLGFFTGGISAGLLGFVLGLITLRLRGIFAAVVAWFVGLALMGLATKLVWLTRGPMGLRTDQLFATSSNVPYYYVILFIMIAVYLISKMIIKSKMGLAFKAIGQNMEAARTSGINPLVYRLTNFTISCSIAGLLGSFYAHYYGILTPDVMHTSKTVEVLVVAYLGGRATLWGSGVIAIPFVFTMELLRSSLANMPGVNLIIYGLLLVLVMIYYPGGFAQFYNNITNKISNKKVMKFFTGENPTK
jgi:branched-chain amino acid transport system permease protein